MATNAGEVEEGLEELGEGEGAEDEGTSGEAPQGEAAQDEQGPSVEDQAREMGWVPETEFRGPKQSFIPAEEFVKRGKNFVPFLRANNERLNERLSAREQENEQLKRQLQEHQSQIDELLNFNTQIAKDRAKEKKGELAVELKKARDDGDTVREIEIQEELDTLRETEKEVEARSKTAKTTPPSRDPTTNPEFQQFIKENPWYGKDKLRTSIANGIGAHIRSENKTLFGKAFFDKVTEEMDKLSGSQTRKSSKVSGGARGSEPGGGGSTNGKTVADLPADARATMKRQADRFVGPGKTFKTEAEWNAHYVKTYFAS